MLGGKFVSYFIKLSKIERAFRTVFLSTIIRYIIIINVYFMNEYYLLKNFIKNYLYKSTVLINYHINLSIYFLFGERDCCLNEKITNHPWYYKNNFFWLKRRFIYG